MNSSSTTKRKRLTAGVGIPSPVPGLPPLPHEQVQQATRLGALTDQVAHTRCGQAALCVRCADRFAGSPTALRIPVPTTPPDTSTRCAAALLL